MAADRVLERDEPRRSSEGRDGFLRSAVSGNIVPGLAQICDTAVIGFSGAAAYVGHLGWDNALRPAYPAAMIAIVCLVISLFHRFGLYRVETITAWPRKMELVVLGMAIAFLVLTGFAFALKISEDYSRVWAFTTFGLSTGLLILGRGALKALVNRAVDVGIMRRKVAIVGVNEQSARLLQRLAAGDERWHPVAGVFDEAVESLPEGAPPYPFCGNLDALEEMVRQGEVNSVIVALPWSDEQRFARIVRRLRQLPVDIYLGADLVAYRLPHARRSSLAGVPVFEVVPMPLSDWAAALKVLEDKVLATILLVTLAPLMLAIAMVIKFDSPGPVLFRQRRYGFNNSPFWIHKFRTMYHRPASQGGVPQATRDDPRVTPVGRFLRRSSLDELPQLFDVLMGRMSLVGPRPHAIAHDHFYASLIRSYNVRHNVKPGITGWAQVNGWRGETDDVEKMRARVEHDIYYIEHWSMWLDFKILLVTALRTWVDRNAY